jgi:hypothetical protein
MKRAIGDSLTSKILASGHRTVQSIAENKDTISVLYFAKSQGHLIDTANKGQVAAKEITVIYLSFTNVRVSIALPGRGVSLEGGTYSRE